MSFAEKMVILITILVLFSGIATRAETWEELLEQADSLSLERNPDSALALGKRALELAEQEFGREDTNVALILHYMGVFSYEKGHFDQAKSFYRGAVAVREKILGPEHPDVGRSLNNLANAYKAQGEYPKAEPLLRRAVAIWEKTLGPEHSNVGVALVNLADLCRNQGKYAEAEPLYKKSLAIFEKALGPDHLNVSYSLTYLAVLYWEQAKYGEAELLHKKALEMRKEDLGPEHLDVGRSLHNLANVYYAQGRYSSAEPLYRKALAIYGKTLDPEHPNVTACLGNLANVCSNQGEYAEAESLYKASLTTEERVLGAKHPEVALSMNNLADFYCQLNRYAEAETLYKRSLMINEKALGSEHPYLAYSLNSLAKLNSDWGNYAEAEFLYERALAIREKALGPEHPDVADVLQGFGTYHRARKHFETSLEMSEKAFRIKQRNFRDNGNVLSEKDALIYSQQVRASANSYLSCSFEAKTEGASLPRQTCDIVLASKGQVSDGIFTLRKSLVTKTDSTTQALAESLRYVKFQLSQLFIAGPGDDTTGAYRRQLDSLSSLANEFESRLTRQSANFRKRQDYKNITADRITSLLPENSVLLEYVRYDYYELKPDSTIPRYMVLLLAGNGNSIVIDLGEACTIDSLISDYRGHMLRVSLQQHMPLQKDTDEYNKLARELYKTVIQPVEDRISGKELILIAPDGGLNLISFAALIDDEGEYLMERHPIHHLSSGRDLIRLKDRQISGRGLLAMGDPDYDATIEARLSALGARMYAAVSEENKYRTRNVRSGCGDLRDLLVEPLPHSRNEIELVAQQWTGSGTDSVVTFFGPQASEDYFKAKATGKRAIHLATHGYFIQGQCNPEVKHRGFGSDKEFMGENPLLLSGLLFAGFNLHGAGADSAGLEDGVLSAYEVSAMNLEGTDLVVLSACETGLGEVKQGEGVYGLRRAFQMAGARTVVSALWPVSDKTTAEMMAELYSKSGKSLPQRIREIQLEQIEKLRSQGLADHPYNWAAFVALGDWR
jgi:CHAT domain-containing protein/Tfp pilus assembly protein PilF